RVTERQTQCQGGESRLGEANRGRRYRLPADSGAIGPAHARLTPSTSSTRFGPIRSMFDTLSERLNGALKRVTGRGRITEDNVRDTVRQIRTALLEADVALPVVKRIVER